MGYLPTWVTLKLWLKANFFEYCQPNGWMKNAPVIFDSKKKLSQELGIIFQWLGMAWLFLLNFWATLRYTLDNYLLVVSTPLKNMLVKMGIFSPRFGMKIKNIWVATTQINILIHFEPQNGVWENDLPRHQLTQATASLAQYMFRDKSRLIKRHATNHFNSDPTKITSYYIIMSPVFHHVDLLQFISRLLKQYQITSCPYSNAPLSFMVPGNIIQRSQYKSASKPFPLKKHQYNEHGCYKEFPTKNA